MNKNIKKRIGILGCGLLGQFLAEKITEDTRLELVCVWDRDEERSGDLLAKVPGVYFTENIEDVKKLKPDIVVEVAHPDVTRQYGEELLCMCDYMIGSPSALADEDLHKRLTHTASHHSLYVPSGAFWGGEDIRKMADLGSLEGLKVSMCFHPGSLKLNGGMKQVNDNIKERTVLYEGPVRNLCSQAPNNVNSMAASCIAAHNLGFDGVTGRLVSDPDLKDLHIVEIEVWGRKHASGQQFHVHTMRSNPANPGQVTGSATLNAFFGSLLRAQGKGPGIHLC